MSYNRNDDDSSAAAAAGLAILGGLMIGTALAVGSDPAAREAARKRQLEREAEARLAARRRQIEEMDAEEEILRRQFRDLQIRRSRV